MPDSKVSWIDRPLPQRTETPFEHHPDSSNPVVRGFLLYSLAQLVNKLPWVQDVLWKNAGFASMRQNSVLENAEPRYEPVVIKTSKSSISPSSADDLLRESWEGKFPEGGAYYSIMDYHKAYQSGQFTPTDVVRALLPLIRRDMPTPTKHATAFLQSRVDLITKSAAESTQRYADGNPLSPLDGVPVAVKDESDVSGYKKCYGSKTDFTRKDDATSHNVLQWLNAGAILIGKTTMHEMGMDTTNNNPNFGTPLNPHNDRYYTGGSSGGSAYAVSSGLVPVAMGNDGGGSIRIPASYCGVYGLKPTHGRVSQRPSQNNARSTTVSGPLAASMSDLELSFRILSHPDPQDPTSTLFLPPQPIPLSPPLPPSRPIGIYAPWFDRSSASVQNLVHNALTHLTSTPSYHLIDISLPLTHTGQIAHATTILTEVLATLPPASISSYTPANTLLLNVGSRSTAIDFLLAQKTRNVIMRHLSALFDQHPGLLIVTPTTPNPGWSFHPSDLKYGCSDGNMQVRNMEYVWLANFTGCPAITCPVGYVDPVQGTEGRVPVGLMAMGEWCDEEGLVGLGYEVERYLGERYKGGRARPGNFVDVFELVREG